jgi:hypothetical protein
MNTPVLMPTLSRRGHAGPESGGCFMEVASLLAGEPWSDRPSAVQPALGILARAVNDLTSDARRPSLAPLIPDAVGTSRADATVSVQLVALAAGRALSQSRGIQRRRLRAALAQSSRLAGSGGPAGWWRRRAVGCYLAGPGGRALREAAVALARAAGPVSDDALRSLLYDAIEHTRRAAGPNAVSDADRVLPVTTT